MHIVNRKIKVLRGYVRLLPRGMMMHHKQETLPLQAPFPMRSQYAQHTYAHTFTSLFAQRYTVYGKSDRLLSALSIEPRNMKIHRDDHSSYTYHNDDRHNVCCNKLKKIT